METNLIFLHGNYQLTLNKKYIRYVVGPDFKAHKLAFIPVRESTYEEWKENVINPKAETNDKYFYAVLTD